MSPNAVSLIGVGFAALAAKLFVRDELRYGFSFHSKYMYLPQIRDYIDGLDGSIFREQTNSNALGHVANTSSIGRAVDGEFDGLSLSLDL